jgi:Viral BACON domain/Putative binding domain, N-terminal
MSITSGSSGTGSGTVRVAVAPNSAAAERAGTLTVGGQAIAVRQDAAQCEIHLSSTSASIGKDAANGTFTVSATESCTWTATSRAAWLTIVSGGMGTGDGTVTYGIEPNRDVTTRTGTIAVVDQLFTVTQAGDTTVPPICDYAVRPVEFTACMTATPMSATITTQPGCSWTAAAGVSWISLSSAASGSGSTVISFTVADNWDAPRHGVLEVRWPTPTAGQNLQIQQAGCTYTVSPNAISVAAAGGTGRFDVFQQSDPYTCGGPLQNGCMWVAQSDVSWIAVTTPMPQFGDNSVSFSFSDNSGGEVRSGRILVRNRAVVVIQAGK